MIQAYFLFISLSLLMTTALAAEQQPFASSSPTSATQEISHPSTQTTQNLKMKRKGKSQREKEAEGSQAPNRFEEDPIIKSKYMLNGQPLEVDPD